MRKCGTALTQAACGPCRPSRPRSSARTKGVHCCLLVKLNCKSTEPLQHPCSRLQSLLDLPSMKLKPPPTRIERQHIYLRYREVFTGQNALLRTKKDIVGAIEASTTSKPSAIQHQKRKTISILRALLEGQIFQSEEQARNEFPELWLKTPKGNKAFPGGEASQLIKLEDFENNILPQSRPQSTLPVLTSEVRCCD